MPYGVQADIDCTSAGLARFAPAIRPAGLPADLRGLIVQSRQAAAAAVNAGPTLMYWRIGARIRHEVLGGERAPYGAKIVVTVSRQLAADYGCGLEEENLRRRVQFAELFADEVGSRRCHGPRIKEAVTAAATGERQGKILITPSYAQCLPGWASGAAGGPANVTPLAER